jgi:hypothetical protein
MFIESEATANYGLTVVETRKHDARSSHLPANVGYLVRRMLSKGGIFKGEGKAPKFDETGNFLDR